MPHTGGPPSPLPRPLPLSPLLASIAAVGFPAAAHLPSTLPRERLWANTPPRTLLLRCRISVPPPPLPPTTDITYLPTSAIEYIVLLPVLYLRDPSPTAPHSTSAGASTHRT